MDLDWTEQQGYLETKFKQFQNLILHQQLTTNQKIYVSNIVSNSYITYSMAAIHYNHKWLKKLDSITAKNINHSMGLRANCNTRPLYASIKEGGKGLTSLVDLQEAISCAQTTKELNSNSLSTLTTANMWFKNPVMESPSISSWKSALHRNHITVKPKSMDLSIIGLNRETENLARELYLKGHASWKDLTIDGKINRYSINNCLKRQATDKELNSLMNFTCQPGSIKLKDHLLTHINFEKKRETIHCTNIAEEESSSYLIHYPTNTIYIFTDGSCQGNNNGGGVYYGPNASRNKNFRAEVAPISTVLELLAIEEALLSSPTNLNIHIITDSKSAIDIINNYKKWPTCKQKNTIAEATIKRILKLIKNLQKASQTVLFTHIYSHINNKRTKATSEGTAETAKFEKKLEAMKNILPGDFNNYIAGNEAADELADLGTKKIPSIKKWEVQEEANQATPFDNQGIPIEGCLRNWVLKNKKAKHNHSIREKNNTTTHPANLICEVEKTRGIYGASAFPYKLRHKLLPTKDAIMHLYWNKSEDNISPKEIPTKLALDKTKATKWLAKQAIYQNQNCPACGKKETQDHALSEECTWTLDKIHPLIEKIDTTIKNNTKKNTLAHKIPLWFTTTGKDRTTDLKLPLFTKLRHFNHREGKAGNVPKTLVKILHLFYHMDKTLAKSTAIKLCAEVTNHYQKLWRERCQKLYKPKAWAQAQEAAKNPPCPKKQINHLQTNR
jgi:ribonuclease HI